MMIQYPPQSPIVGSEVSGGSRYWHGLSQRKGEGFKQESETTARAGPGHFYLSGFLTTIAAHTGHLSMDISHKLEKVQMAPGA